MPSRPINVLAMFKLNLALLLLGIDPLSIVGFHPSSSHFLPQTIRAAYAFSDKNKTSTRRFAAASNNQKKECPSNDKDEPVDESSTEKAIDALPGGSWIKSSRNIEVSQDAKDKTKFRLKAELATTVRGKWDEDEVTFSKGDKFANVDGTFVREELHEKILSLRREQEDEEFLRTTDKNTSWKEILMVVLNPFPLGALTLARYKEKAVDAVEENKELRTKLKQRDAKIEELQEKLHTKEKKKKTKQKNSNQ